MSDEAIKLELAQDRLRRSIQKGPAAYREQARAELGVRNAERALRGETDALTRSQDRNRRGLGQLRGSLVGYASAFLGAAGVLSVLRSSTAAAREEELVMGQTSIAVAAAGLSWERYAKRIETVIRAQSRLGFDDEELIKTFQTFVRSTRDVDEALKLNALSADLARARYMDLESASKLVLKASMGQAGALRRVGIDAETGATGVELITKLTESYGQAAEKASTTGQAAADRFDVAIENLQESIGRGLSPTVTEYTDRITKWLDKAENQEELQRRVNATLKTAEGVVQGVAGAFRVLDRTLGPVVGHLGGVERAVELAIGAGLVYKAAKAVAAVRGLALSFGLVGPAAAVAAAQTVAAENAIGTGAVAAAGKVSLIRVALLRTLGTALAVQAAVDAITPGGQGLDFSDPTSVSTTPVNRGGVWVNPQTGQPIENGRYWDKLVAGGFYDPSTGKRERPSRQERREARNRLAGIDPASSTSGGTALPTVPKIPTGAGSLPTTPLIAAAVEQGAARGTEKGVRAATEAERREAARMERILASATRTAQRQYDLYEQAGLAKANTPAELRAAALRHVDEVVGGLKKGGAGKAGKDPVLTGAQLASMQYEFLTRLTGDVAQWGSNFMPGSGALETQAYVQTAELRAQTAAVQRLIEGSWHPGAQLASAELSAVGWGVGF